MSTLEYVTRRLKPEDEEFLVNATKGLVEKIEESIFTDTEKETLNWKVLIAEKDGKIYLKISDSLERVNIDRVIEPGVNIFHKLFTIQSDYQGKGIANISGEFSLKIADYFKINTISLSANLDVGGYAWLRKGAFPVDGVDGLLYAAKPGDLKNRLISRISNLDEIEVRAFVLTDEFKEYKDLFLGSSWIGNFDLTDEKIRGKIVGKPDAIAKTSNEEILDRYIRHQTYLLRYAGGLRNQVLPTLVSTEKKLYDSIIQWVAKAEGNRTLTGARGRAWQREFKDALNGIWMPAWNDILDEVRAQLSELAISEAATGAAIIEASVPVVIGMTLPPAAQLTAIVNSQPFQGRTLKEWMERTAQADVDRILTAAKIGITQGQTPTEVARGIIGSRRAKYQDGMARKAFRDLESVLLTLTNGIQNEAKQALYQANSDIIERELFVATLDARTTLTCASNDGKTFALGTGPIPPLHFRCRSLRVPYINPENLRNRGFDPTTEKQLLQEYSQRANIPQVKKRSDLPRGYKTKFDEFARKRRRELVGQVPAQTTYNEWLKKQSKEFQDEVLGPTRAEMFRKGDLHLDKFVARDGDVLTLDELRRKGLEVPD